MRCKTLRVDMTFVSFVYFVLFLHVCVDVKSSDLETLNVNGSHEDEQVEINNVYVPCDQRTIAKTIPKGKISYPTSVTLRNCLPPTTSYAKELEAVNINTSYIERLKLKLAVDAPLSPRGYMEGLTNLKILELYLDKTSNSLIDIFKDVQDIVDPLYSLKEIKTYIPLPRVPITMKLRELLLIDDGSIYEWGNCDHLEKLSFRGEKTVPKWPEKCSRLKYLLISEMPESVHKVLANMTHAASNLTSLTLTGNLLYLMPNEFLAAARQLQHLDLSNNNLYDKAFLDFPIMNTLSSLTVNENLVKGSFLGHIMPRLPALRQIYLQNNKQFYAYCHLDDGLDQGIGYLTQSYIEEISFRQTYMHIDCFYHKHFKNLTTLNMISTASPVFYPMKLPTTEAENLTIKFCDETKEYHFSEIYFSEEDYQEFHKRNASLNNGTHYNPWIVMSTYINCNCKNNWLARALRDFPNFISMPDLRCNHEEGTPILEESLDNMECKIWSERDSEYKCDFRQVWREEEIDAKCDGIVPWKSNLRNLDVSNSGLTSFFADLPPSVKLVDYRDNHISSANQTALDTMFFNGRKVWLGNNDIVCNCETHILIDGIQEHQNQVMDYSTLTCIGTGQLISSVSTTELCRTSLKITLAVVSILVGLILLLVIICRIYQEEIRIFLYSKGWCLNWLRRIEFDDKPYDAFISYAHGDDDFVKEVLVPGLENCQEKFRLCIHFRDWEVGGWIPAQIMHSVTHSKRTIIVLSKSFVASSWSALEFRYAIANTSADNLSRVLIIVLDDVLDTNLNPELQGYLDFNTYLRYDDPWFWKRLRYAMPHRNKIKDKEANKPPTRNAHEENTASEMINMIILMESNTLNSVSS